MRLADHRSWSLQAKAHLISIGDCSLPPTCSPRICFAASLWLDPDRLAVRIDLGHPPAGWTVNVRRTFVEELLAASEDQILSRSELQELLRSAASRLREQEAADALERLCNINDVRARKGLPVVGLDAILEDWSIAQGDGPFNDLDEDTETKGSA